MCYKVGHIYVTEQSTCYDHTLAVTLLALFYSVQFFKLVFLFLCFCLLLGFFPLNKTLEGAVTLLNWHCCCWMPSRFLVGNFSCSKSANTLQVFLTSFTVRSVAWKTTEVPVWFQEVPQLSISVTRMIVLYSHCAILQLSGWEPLLYPWCYF